MRNILQSPVPFSVSAIQGKRGIVGAVGLLLLEWFAFYHKTEYAVNFIKGIPNSIVRLMIYLLLFLFILMFTGNQVGFIYAQF
jgi:hypothetical protein